MSSFDDPSREPDPDARRMSRIVRYLDNDGTALALETRGIGRRKLVFAHGWISSRRMFYDVVARLDPTLFTSHLLDFRGCGLSDRPSSGFDVEGYASDLRAAILDVEGPVTVVAHSMGGKIAQYVALDPPENMRGMVLIAPGSARALPQNERRRSLTRDTFGSRARIETFTRAAMVRDIAPDSLERLIDDALTASHEAWFTWHDLGRLEDFSDRLASIAMRTLVIAGRRDPLVPTERLRRDVVAAIAGATLETIANVGHNIPVEAPDEIARLIEVFVNDRASSGTR